MAPRLLRVVLFLLCLVQFVAAAPAGAASRDVTSSSRADVLARVRTHLDRTSAAIGGPAAQHRSVTQTLRSVRDHSDEGAWIGAIADLIEQRSESEVTSTSEPVTDDGEGEYTGSRGSAVSAGDLDGDGRDDLLMYHSDFDSESFLLEARRGTDAAALWERAVGGDEAVAWSLDRDMTGDGRADILELTLDIISEGYAESCGGHEDEEECGSGGYSATYRWALSLVSGSDGSAAWTHTYDGAISEQYSESWKTTAQVTYREEVVYDLSATAIGLLPIVADLPDGGGSEIVLNVFDVREHFESKGRGAHARFVGAGTSEGNYTFSAVTDATVLDAGTGGATWRYVEDSPGMFAVLYPLARAGGDDLMWERSLQPARSGRCVHGGAVLVYQGHCLTDDEGPGVRLTLLNGATYEPTWTRDFQGWGASFPVGGDLDADGRGDLVLYLDTDEDWGTQFLTSSTGTTLWTDQVGYVAVGPLDAVAGDDLVTVAYASEYPDDPTGLGWLISDEEETYVETMTVERRNGASGTAFLSESRSTTSSGSTWAFPYAMGGSDGDGDGAPDITVGTVVVDESSDDEDWTVTGRDVVAQSGATAKVLYAADNGSLLFPEPDIDGDGLSEVAQIGEAAGGSTYTPVRLTDGVALWTDRMASDRVAYVADGNIDGVPGTDVLRHEVVIHDRRAQTIVSSLAGRSGVQRWSFGSRP